MKRTTTRLKELLARRTATPMPGAANAMFARVIEDLGFEAVYVTGAGIANMYLGVPDIGLTTLTEIADHIAPIADAIEIPSLLEGWKAGDLPAVKRLQGQVRAKFAEEFAKGYAAVGVARTAGGSAYQLAPWSDF